MADDPKNPIPAGTRPDREPSGPANTDRCAGGAGIPVDADRLRIDAEPTCGVYSAWYDPEGPIGRGRTRAAAVGDLIDLCDDDHRGPLLLESICALERALAKYLSTTNEGSMK